MLHQFVEDEFWWGWLACFVIDKLLLESMEEDVVEDNQCALVLLSCLKSDVWCHDVLSVCRQTVVRLIGGVNSESHDTRPLFLISDLLNEFLSSILCQTHIDGSVEVVLSQEVANGRQCYSCLTDIGFAFEEDEVTLREWVAKVNPHMARDKLVTNELTPVARPRCLLAQVDRLCGEPSVHASCHPSKGSLRVAPLEVDLMTVLRGHLDLTACLQLRLLHEHGDAGLLLHADGDSIHGGSLTIFWLEG